MCEDLKKINQVLELRCSQTNKLTNKQRDRQMPTILSIKSRQCVSSVSEPWTGAKTSDCQN